MFSSQYSIHYDVVANILPSRFLYCNVKDRFKVLFACLRDLLKRDFLKVCQPMCDLFHVNRLVPFNLTSIRSRNEIINPDISANLSCGALNYAMFSILRALSPKIFLFSVSDKPADLIISGYSTSRPSPEPDPNGKSVA